MDGLHLDAQRAVRGRLGEVFLAAHGPGANQRRAAARQSGIPEPDEDFAIDGFERLVDAPATLAVTSFWRSASHSMDIRVSFKNRQ